MNRSLQPLPDLCAVDGGKLTVPFPRLLFCSLQAHAILFYISIIYFVAVNVYYDLNHLQRMVEVALGLGGIVATSLLIGAVYRFYVYVTDTRPHHPISQLYRDFRSLVRDRRRMSLIVPTALSMAIFMETFREAKSAIVVNAEAFWDQTFTRWDLVLHFGTLPWQWLQPVFGNPVLSFLVNLNYNPGFWSCGRSGWPSPIRSGIAPSAPGFC